MESKAVSPESIATNSKGINYLDAPTKLKFPVDLGFNDVIEEHGFHEAWGSTVQGKFTNNFRL